MLFRSTIGSGIIGIITVTNPGSGYTSSPSITFVGIASTSAQAIANIDTKGSIISIQITNAGLGYTQAPSIVIGSPSNIGIGTYLYNEVVTGSRSGITARVRSWNAINSQLEVSNVSGSFVHGEILTGQTSGATYYISVINDNNIHDGYADNQVIETEADKIIDFSQRNPFGVP